jgi:hypothetical protein
MIIADVQEARDEGNYVLGVRESLEDGARGLIFIEGSPGGDEEMDSYCLVAAPSQAVCYGGVKQWEIGTADEAGRAGVLHLELDAETAEVLELPRSATFDLILTAEHLEMLRNGLRKILDSKDGDELSAGL